MQFPALEPTNSDRMRIECAYRAMADVSRYPYLEQDRCVPAVVLVLLGHKMLTPFEDRSTR
jgi:hypothetical protein